MWLTPVETKGSIPSLAIHNWLVSYVLDLWDIPIHFTKNCLGPVYLPIYMLVSYNMIGSFIYAVKPNF